MGFIPAANVVRVEVVYQWQGEIVENVYHFLGASTPALTDMNALATAVRNWRSTSLRPLQSNTCLHSKVKVRDLSAIDGQGVELLITPADQGNLTDASLPNNCAVAVAIRSGLAGRSNRGRTFHVGLTEALRTGNQVTGTTQTALIAAYTALMGPFTTNNYHLGILSLATGGHPRTAGVFTQAASITCDANLDSQRRRLPGHNRHH